MLLLHIIVALMSMILSTYLVVRPSASLIKVSYGLIAATSASGIYLMIANPAYAIRGCIAYLSYTVFVTVLTARAHRRLAQQEI